MLLHELYDNVVTHEHYITKNTRNNVDRVSTSRTKNVQNIEQSFYLGAQESDRSELFFKNVR